MNILDFIVKFKDELTCKAYLRDVRLKDGLPANIVDVRNTTGMLLSVSCSIVLVLSEQRYEVEQ